MYKLILFSLILLGLQNNVEAETFGPSSTQNKKASINVEESFGTVTGECVIEAIQNSGGGQAGKKTKFIFPYTHIGYFHNAKLTDKCRIGGVGNESIFFVPSNTFSLKKEIKSCKVPAVAHSKIQEIEKLLMKKGDISNGDYEKLTDLLESSSQKESHSMVVNCIQFFSKNKLGEYNSDETLKKVNADLRKELAEATEKSCVNGGFRLFASRFKSVGDCEARGKRIIALEQKQEALQQQKDIIERREQGSIKSSCFAVPITASKEQKNTQVCNEIADICRSTDSKAAEELRKSCGSVSPVQKPEPSGSAAPVKPATKNACEQEGGYIHGEGTKVTCVCPDYNNVFTGDRCLAKNDKRIAEAEKKLNCEFNQEANLTLQRCVPKQQTETSCPATAEKVKECAGKNLAYSEKDCKCVAQQPDPNSGPGRFNQRDETRDCTAAYRSAYQQTQQLAQQGAQGQQGGGFNLGSITKMFGGLMGGGGAGGSGAAGCEEAASAGKRDAQRAAQQQQGGQQQQPQQPPQPIGPPPQPLQCAGVQASNRTIEPGKQVTIKFSIPGATTFELRGGPGSVSVQGAVVRPTETTTYYIVGKNPQMQYAAQQYAAQGYNQQGYQQGYSAPQYGQQPYQQYGGFQSVDIQQQGMYLDQVGQGGQVGFGTPVGSVGGSYGSTSQTPGEGICGPITIQVESKKKITTGEKDLDAALGDAQKTAFKNAKPVLKCPASVVRGKPANILWSCPDDPANSDGKIVAIGASVHDDNTPVEDAERINIDKQGRVVKELQPDSAKRTLPVSDIEYGIVCKNEKNVRTKVAKCFVEVVEPGKQSSSRSSTSTRSSSAGGVTTGTSAATPSQSVYIDAKPRVISVSKREEVTVKWGAPNSYTCSVRGPSGYTSTLTTGSVTGGSDEPGQLVFTFVCNEGSESEVVKEVTVEAVE